ncbi:ABC transporter substrate-binding protein [Ruegeria sp. HKCCD8929]|uniref:ABC transporter substrate-binding protein n=1 Tax=Ruegeria sp. HKCCD8929 TaxID=2683006 RepID=UPI001489D197|nr:ABC transporter substrate-binding protein [Ruegeria sp. HKCCD8929]
MKSMILVRKCVLRFAVLLSLFLAMPFTVQAGGVLTVAVGTNLNNLDPAKAKLAEESIYGFMVFNGLTMIDSDLITKPDLAERWESSDDLKIWTFYLRKGVKFHHGRELNAEDVAATIERILVKETGSKARVDFLVVDEIQVLDKYRIQFKLNSPYADFPEILAHRRAGIVPSDRIDTLTTAPIGTGPFKFKSYTPGDQLELVKNADYFEGAPHLDGVTMRILPESSVRVAALESGEVDVLWRAPVEAADLLKENPNVVVESVPTSTWDAIIMNNNNPPFDNLKVRQAIHLTIDKEQLAKIVLFGKGTTTHTPIPPSHPFFNSSIGFKTDIDKAKKLLAEAGYPNGFEIEMFVPGNKPTRVRLGVAAREMLKPLGIDVQIKRVTWDKFVSEAEGKATFYTSGFSARSTPDTMLYPWYHSNGSWNNGLWHYKDSRVDELLDLARETLSMDDRKKIYMDIQEIVVKDPPSIISYNLNHIDAYQKDIKGLHSHPMMWLDLRKVTK